MEVTPELLLDHLPPYRDEWVVVKRDQSVGDIIRDVVEKHREFSPYYDRISSFFNCDDVGETCEELYRFCKRYLRYREEPEEAQTTSLPTGLLSRGFCDCKGYASFIGGVLDSIARQTGKKIDWAYRFASYHPLDPSPHHVFIVVNDPDEGEIWVDPTPRSRDMWPSWQLDKKISGMPLYSNIAGLTSRRGVGNGIGIASLTVSPRTSFATNMNFAGAPWPYGVEPFQNFLGLDMYRDYGGDRNINEANVAAALDALIAKGPDPGHTIDPAFVKWVYDNSIRSWNFFYRGGVEPGWDETKFIPKTFSWINSAGHSQTIAPPKWVVTPDHRVTFDHDVSLDDYRNWLIHILTAAAQKYINQYDTAPFPLKPADLKNFSQAYTGNPTNPSASILREWRGSSDVAKAIQASTSILSNTILKVAGSIPRNAFLALVGLNVFHMATDLQNSVNAGNWSHISDTWKMLGGDPSKLQSTITHGAGQPEIDDTTHTVDDASSGIAGIGAAIGVVQIAAIIAAATPIIAALANYFTHASVHSTAQTYADQLNASNPAGHYTMVNGQLYSNGQPVTMTGQTATASTLQSLLFPAAAFGLTYWVVNRRRKKQNKTLLLPALVGVGTFFVLKLKSSTPAPATIAPGVMPSTATSPGSSPLSTIFNALPNILKPLVNPVTSPTAPVTAGDANPLNPDLSSTDAGLAGWAEGREPFFDD